MIEAFITGLTLGLGSGAAPGPLTGLAITTTMRSGFQAGLRIAVAPLLSDTLIIALSITLVSQLPERGIQVLGILGAVVVGFFGVETLISTRKANPPSSEEVPIPRKLDRLPLLVQGATLNVLNPAPWIFWVTAGSTLLVGFWRENPVTAVVFLIIFYVMLVGTKVLIVIGLAATRHRMTTRTYRGVLYSSGVLLLVAAVLLFVSHVL